MYKANYKGIHIIIVGKLIRILYLHRAGLQIIYLILSN